MTTARSWQTIFDSGRLRWLELALVGALSLLSIATLVTGLNLSPDSSSYITAASNFVKTGRLFIFVNTPSFSMSPVVEPYTEQPPGFPLYLALFIAAFKDPIISALIAQSLAIVFYYGAIYFMTVELRLALLLRIQTLILAGALETLRLLQSNIMSEILFLALSLTAGILSLRILRGARNRFDSHLLILSLALASSLRFVGLANAIWASPLVFRRGTVQGLLGLLQKRRVGYGLVLAGISLIALSASVDLLVFSREPNIGSNQLLGLIIGSAILATGLYGLLRLEQLREFNGRLGSSELNRDEALWALGAFGAAIVPVLLWLLKNRLIFGQFTRSHRAFEVFNTVSLVTPFELLWTDLFDTRIGPSIIIVVAGVGLWAISFAIGSNGERKILRLLIGVTLTHFALVWIPSLIASFEPVGSRYLTPAVLFGVLATLYAIQVTFNSVGPSRWRYGLLLLPAVFLLLGRNIALGGPTLRNLSVNYPVERQLWSDIRDIEDFDASTHFYSNRIFEHQIFAGIPQRIFWDHSLIRDQELLEELLSRGENPFILLQKSSSEAKQLENLLATSPLELRKIEFPSAGFILYSSEG